MHVRVHGGAQPDGHPTLLSVKHSSSSSPPLSSNPALLTSARPLNSEAASHGWVWQSEASLASVSPPPLVLQTHAPK